MGQHTSVNWLSNVWECGSSRSIRNSDAASYVSAMGSDPSVWPEHDRSPGLQPEDSAPAFHMAWGAPGTLSSSSCVADRRCSIPENHHGWSHRNWDPKMEWSISLKPLEGSGAEDRYDLFERALYMVTQKQDETNDSCLARHDIAFEGESGDASRCPSIRLGATVSLDVRWQEEDHHGQWWPTDLWHCPTQHEIAGFKVLSRSSRWPQSTGEENVWCLYDGRRRDHQPGSCGMGDSRAWWRTGLPTDGWSRRRRRHVHPGLWGPDRGDDSGKAPIWPPALSLIKKPGHECESAHALVGFGPSRGRAKAREPRRAKEHPWAVSNLVLAVADGGHWQTALPTAPAASGNVSAHKGLKPIPSRRSSTWLRSPLRLTRLQFTRSSTISRRMWRSGRSTGNKQDS